MAATATPKNLHVAEDNDEEDMMTNGNGTSDQSRDLETDDTIKDPVEDRRTLAERNERLHDQLKVGTRSLSGIKRNAKRLFLPSSSSSSLFPSSNNKLKYHKNQMNTGLVAPGVTVIDSEIQYAARLCVLSDPCGNVQFKSSRFVVRFEQNHKFYLL